MTTYTIGDVAHRTGLSIDTLRYYERIELVTDVDRTAVGHRRYSDDDTRANPPTVPAISPTAIRIQKCWAGSSSFESC